MKAVLLQNGLYVLLDIANVKLKVFDNCFNLNCVKDLKKDPKDLCKMHISKEENVVILFKSLMERYAVNCSTISLAGQTSIGNEGIAVTEFGANMFALLKWENSCGNFIEVRQIHNAAKLDVITNFICVSETIPAKEAISLHSISDKMLVGTKNMLLRINREGKCSWFCKNGVPCSLKEVTCMDTDGGENIFLCCKTLGTIQCVNTNDYQSRRNIIKNLTNPTCVVYNSRLAVLIVGCEQGDRIKIYRCE